MIDKKLPGTAQAGFTLIELMITITILAVLLAIGVPAYQNYIATATEGTLVKNINTMEMFQEDFFLRNGNYSVGLANIAAIDAAIGWEPRTDDGVTYSVADGPSGDASDYNVTAIHPDGTTVCLTMPDRTRC